MLTITASLVMLGLMILIHEAGHYAAARSMGVGVEAFSIGFGPSILRVKTRSGTIFRVGIIPFGGYVKLKGEDAKNTEKPEISENESGISGIKEENQVKGKNFQSISYLGKLLIFFAGPAANLILGYAFFFGMDLTGKERLLPVVGKVIQNSPAEGIFRKGDKIISINGEKIKYWDEISPLIQKYSGNNRELLFKVKRNEKIISLRVKPEYNSEYRRYIVGISPSGETVIVRVSLPEALKDAFNYLIKAILLLFVATGLLVKGKVPASEVAGPVGTIYAMTRFSKTIRDFLMLSGLISANLAFVNLLPVPGLDGGQIILTTVDEIYKKIKGKEMSENLKSLINFVGIAFLITLLILATANDITRLIFKK